MLEDDYVNFEEIDKPVKYKMFVSFYSVEFYDQQWWENEFKRIIKFLEENWKFNYYIGFLTRIDVKDNVSLFKLYIAIDIYIYDSAKILSFWRHGFVDFNTSPILSFEQEKRKFEYIKINNVVKVWKK